MLKGHVLLSFSFLEARKKPKGLYSVTINTLYLPLAGNKKGGKRRYGR
jgi:hypothetical protein